jgi:hypothetical protein
MTTFAVRFRRDTTTGWTATNPVLGLGEAGWDRTTGVVKLGDDTTPWLSLPIWATIGNEAAVAQALANEQSARVAADQALATNLAAEINTRSTADVGLGNRAAALEAIVAGLGTASTRNVALSGDAAATQVVLGSDSRLPVPFPPESGLLFSVTDSTGRVAFGIGTDGSLVTPDGSFVLAKGYLMSELAGPPESGYVWAVTDSTGRVGLGIRPNGTVTGTFEGFENFSSNGLGLIARRVFPTSDIATWGDSMTSGAGGGGTTYQSVLAAALGRSVYNGGVGGEGSTSIAARQGGVPTLLTVAGNQIPASGSVAVTARSVSPLTSQGPGVLAGTLAGVQGHPHPRWGRLVQLRTVDRRERRGLPGADPDVLRPGDHLRGAHGHHLVGAEQPVAGVGGPSGRAVDG